MLSWMEACLGGVVWRDNMAKQKLVAGLYLEQSCSFDWVEGPRDEVSSDVVQR